MDFDRDWHTFSLDAEVDAYGTSRIAGAHNRLREENARLKGQLVEMYERIIPEEIAKGLERLTRERDEAREQVGRMADAHIANARLEAEVARLEGLILVGYKWLDPERPSNLTWDEGGPHETDAFEAEARRIRAQREGCRVCATKAVGLPTPGYTHDESCAQREKGE